MTMACLNLKSQYKQSHYLIDDAVIVESLLFVLFVYRFCQPLDELTNMHLLQRSLLYVRPC